MTGQAALDVVHMYVGNPGSTVSSGIAYGSGMIARHWTILLLLRRRKLTELPDVAGKIASSALFDDTQLSIDAVLIGTPPLPDDLPGE